MKKNPQPFVITEFQIKTRSHQSLKQWKAKCRWGNGVCKREDPSLPCVGGTPGLAPSPAASLHRDWGWVLGCRLRASPSPSRYRHLGNELMDGSSSCLRRKINNFLEISHCWTKAKGIGKGIGQSRACVQVLTDSWIQLPTTADPWGSGEDCSDWVLPLHGRQEFLAPGFSLGSDPATGDIRGMSQQIGTCSHSLTLILSNKYRKKKDKHKNIIGQ